MKKFNSTILLNGIYVITEEEEQFYTGFLITQNKPTTYSTLANRVEQRKGFEGMILCDRRKTAAGNYQLEQVTQLINSAEKIKTELDNLLTKLRDSQVIIALWRDLIYAKDYIDKNCDPEQVKDKKWAIKEQIYEILIR